MKKISVLVVIASFLLILLNSCKKEYCICNSYFEGTLVETFEQFKEEDQMCKIYEHRNETGADSIYIICKLEVK
jgi:hypothetical protein